MKKLLALIPLLCFALGVRADFTPADHGNKQAQDRTVVFFDLTVNGNKVDPDFFANSYQVAAFIGDECRATATVEYGQTQTPYLQIVVPGNYGADNADDGQPITFKLFDILNQCTYPLTCAPEVTYDPTTTYGVGASSNDHVQLSVTMPNLNDETSIILNDITVTVGTSVNLASYATVSPQGALLPEERAWSLGNYANYGTIEGDVFTAGRTTGTIEYTLTLPDGMEPTGAPKTKTYTGSITILSPATAITTKETSYSVNINDARTLTNFLDGNYTLTPAGSTDVVIWSIANTTIISYSTQSEFAYTPIAVGETTATPQILNEDGTVRLSGSPVTITVLQPVTAIEISDEGIMANVGDTDIKARLEQLITVKPDNASNKNLSWSIEQDEEHLRLDADAETGTTTITAVAYGYATVVVTTTDGSKISRSLGVNVVDPATEATFTNNPLEVTITSNDGTDISDFIFRNITLNGSSPKTASVSLTDVTPEGAVEGNGNINDNGNSGTFTAYKAGSANVKVTVTWQNWSKAEQESQDFTFKLNIVENIPLTAFKVTITPDATKKNTGTITLTPVPSNATINAEDYTLSAPKNMYSPWTMVEFKQTSTTPITFSYNGLLPGDCNFMITDATGNFAQTFNAEAAEQTQASPLTLQIPYVVELAQGWQWKSNVYGVASSTNELKNLFGDTNLSEARTHQTLLYNDAAWGYLGTMIGTGIGQCVMYKAKMATATTSYLSNGEVSSHNTVTLKPGWTWVGSPYFYSRQLSNVVSAEGLANGFVIVGKNGSVETTSGQWVGNLATIDAGQGYVVFNPTGNDTELLFADERNMNQPTLEQQQTVDPNPSRSNRIWSYDPSRFADNMTMVVSLDGVANIDNYSLGAFVGNECRGEGVAVNGMMFVTVHANRGELVSFRLYNELTGEYADVEQTVKAMQRVGSISAPFKMTSDAIALGISNVNSTSGSAAKTYDLQGRETRQAAGQHSKISIVRMSDGTVRKVMK